MSQRLAAAALSLALLSGCYTTRVSTSAAPRAAAQTERTNFHFLFGLTAADVPAIECPAGIATLEQQMPWWSAFLSGFTFGLVGATTTKYSCVAGPASANAAP
jgi:hypothetical protein